MSSRSWKSNLVIVISAVVVIVVADMLLAKVAPPLQRREVADGLRDFARLNPDTLVLGSSHGRTLHVLGQELQARTGGSQTLVAVPLENGKIVPYKWVLDHKLLPLIDQRDAQGNRVKSRLQRFILITEWWDTCPHPDGVYWNLPGRAWEADDFLRDVGQHGITGYNRNYLQTALRRSLPYSSLIYDRTQSVLVTKMRDEFVDHSHFKPTEAEIASQYRNWRSGVEAGIHCIGNPEQMQALAGIADSIRARGLEMTIILFPRKPGTLTQKARATTLPRFAQLVHSVADPRGIRVIDMTLMEPIHDEDFMEDFDHINASGNRKFAAWALDHQLSFLMQPRAAAVVASSTSGSKQP